MVEMAVGNKDLVSPGNVCGHQGLPGPGGRVAGEVGINQKHVPVCFDLKTGRSPPCDFHNSLFCVIGFQQRRLILY
jgi:hypothetical protein